MKKIHLAKLFCLLFIFPCCKFDTRQNSFTNLYDTLNKINDRRDFLFSVPLDSQNNPDKFYKRYQAFYNAYDTINLENGFQDLCFKISSDFDGSGHFQYYLVKLVQNKWEGYFITFENDPDANQYRKIKKIIKEVIPKNGWPNLITKLLEFKIFSNPTMNKVPINLLVSEGKFNSFEIATKKTYKFYYYYDESLFVNSDIPEVEWKNTTGIINLLKSEMQTK